MTMASLETPKTWIPYMNNRDCSQGFCTLYCPQWCSIFYPPPPHFEFPDDNASPTFSPLVIAIIGILASAFLLVSYYTIISKYCGNNGSAGRRDQNHNNHNEEFEDNRNPSLREPWDVATTGLDEALIKSITACKYKKGDGLIGVTDCSVCLSEFQEDENVRLLPKCSHAFHLPCIDTWLKSHSNCPLCRANIFFISAPLLPPPPPFAHENPQNSQPALHENQHGDDNINVTQQHPEVDHASEEEVVHNDTIPKTPLRVCGDSIVEIRDDLGCHQHLRRSVSMDHQSCRNPRRSVADVLSMNQDHQVIEIEEESCMEDIVGSPKNSAEESKSNCRRKVLNCCVPSDTTVKRSLSSGRILSRH